MRLILIGIVLLALGLSFGSDLATWLGVGFIALPFLIILGMFGIALLILIAAVIIAVVEERR